MGVKAREQRRHVSCGLSIMGQKRFLFKGDIKTALLVQAVEFKVAACERRCFHCF